MKRKLCPEDILKFEAIGEPQWSPTDNSFIFLKSITDTNENKKKAAVFYANENGSIEQLTDYSLGAKQARWSPCGKYLAFTARHNSKNSIWIINLATKELKPLVIDQTVISPAIWSPDGKKIAFIAKDYCHGIEWNSYNGAPENDSTRAWEQATATKDNKAQNDVLVITSIRYRFNETGYFGELKNQVFVTDVPKWDDETWGFCQRVTTADCDFGWPTWNNNSDGLYVVGNLAADADVSLINNIYFIDLSNLQMVLKVSGTGNISNLLLSPNGSELAFWANVNNDPRLWFDNVFIYQVNSTKVVEVLSLENVTEDFYRTVGNVPSSSERFSSTTSKYQWLANGQGFTVIYSDHGASALAEIYRDKKKESYVIWQDSLRCVSAFSRKEERFVLIIGGMEDTESLYIFENSQEQLLYRTNDWLAEDIELGIGSRFNFQGAEGLPLDGWLLTPPAWDKHNPLPLILFIHGGPHGVYGSCFMFQAQVLASNGYAVAYVNPRGSASYGKDFANLVYLDWGGGDYEDIMAGVDHLIATGIADKDRLGVTGWSYGGYMTSWIITQTNRFKAALAGASVINRYSMYGTSDIGFYFGEKHFGGNPWDNGLRLLDRSPLNYVYRVQTPVLLIHGEDDYRCPISQSEEFFTALKRQRKEVVMVRYPKEPHNFKQPRHLEDRYARTLAWFDYYITK